MATQKHISFARMLAEVEVRNSWVESVGRKVLILSRKYFCISFFST